MADSICVLRFPSSPGHVDQGGCKTSPPRGEPHPALPRTGRKAASSALEHPWGLSLCHPSRVRVMPRGWVKNPAPTGNSGQPGCYGSAVHGLETRRVAEKSCRNCLKSWVKGGIGDKLRSPPHWTLRPRDLLQDGPLRDSSEQISPLICFVLRAEARERGKLTLQPCLWGSGRLLQTKLLSINIQLSLGPSH